MRIFLIFLIICIALSTPKAVVQRRDVNWKNAAKVGAIGLGAGVLGYLGYKGVKHIMNKGEEHHEGQGQPTIGQGASVDESFEKKNH